MPEIKSYPLPRGAVAVAVKRTKPLVIYGLNFDKPLSNIAASCYLQGMSDAAELMRPAKEEG